MRKTETQAAGWVRVGNPVPADTTLTTISWREGFTEYQVFAVGPEGVAEPVGDRTAYTFR